MKTISLNEKNMDFFQLVFEVVKLIPEGRVSNYGAIARYLSAPKSSRMVGWAMNASHREKGIPAHRVVNRNGILTGKAHFDPPEAMETALKAEGIEVKNDQVLHFKSVFWDPNIELQL
jgi:methylated-DNA-protein-cysteine methyltransferase-like protein